MRYYRQTIFSVRNVIIFTLFPALFSSFLQNHSLWLTLIAFVLLLEAIRHYFPKISEERVPENLVLTFWVIFGTSWAYFRQGHSLWMSLLMFLVLLGFSGLIKIIRKSVYWEIRGDCVIQRRYFRRIVFPFSEITYVGPMTGAANQYGFFAKHILIQNISGGQIIVETPQYEAFLEEMRKHLPLITLNL